MWLTVLKYFKYSLFTPFWAIQKILPRKKYIWVFGAWFGERFSDNSMYLYQYIYNNNLDIRAIWITANKGILISNRNKGFETYMKWSIKGIWFCLIAKYVFVTSSKQDVNEFFLNGAILVNLWHGSPLKKIGLDDNYSRSNSYFQNNVVKRYFPFVYEYNFNFIISNSKIFTPLMASSYNMSSSQILETGCPRNDIFFEKEEDVFNENLRKKFRGCKIIYYLPTFRGNQDAVSLFSIDSYNESQLEQFLESHNLVFVSKGHFVDHDLVTINSSRNSRLIDLKEDEVSEINFMLKDADLLITDYSSAYFDYLLTERPIIFAAFDLANYLTGSREMYFEYEEVIAGPMIRNWQQLYDALINIWSNKEYKKLVKIKNKEFNKFHDNNNSKRVFEEITSKDKL